jgi:hypothetical protein
LDLPAERRLRDAQRFCRASEVTLSRDRHEVAKLSEFQTIPPWYGSDQFSLGHIAPESAK